MDNVNASNVVQLDLPATYKYLNVLGSVISALLERMDDIANRDIVAYNLELAVHETCTNIVEHAYAGREGRIRVVLTIDSNPNRITIDLQDSGNAFDIAKVPTPDLSKAHVNGYGLFLMHQLVDEVSYTPNEGNNRWRLIKKLG